MLLFRPGTRFGVVLLILAGLVFSGCSQEEPSTAEPAVQQKPAKTSLKPQPRILVPEEVAEDWKAVAISVLDKDSGTEEVYQVDIGSSIVLPATDVRLEVLVFLPHFIMDGRVMTSASGDTKNPAAQVAIHDGERQVFQGWIFSLYPGTHAFQHPRYSFTLVDFVRAPEKG